MLPFATQHPRGGIVARLGASILRAVEEFRGLVGVKTGHTGAAGWCEVAEVKRDGLDVYATILGSPSRGQRNHDLAALLRWALGVERPAWVVAPDHEYARVSVGYGRAPLSLVAARGDV